MYNIHIYIYIYIYTHIDTYVCIHVYIYIHIYICIYTCILYTYICMYTCIYVCIYTHVCVDRPKICKYVHMYTYLYIYIHICTIYLYTYINIYIHTYTCTYPQTKEIRLAIIVTAKISNKFSQESSYISNTCSWEFPRFQTRFHVSERSPRQCKRTPGKPANLEIQIFKV